MTNKKTFLSEYYHPDGRFAQVVFMNNIWSLEYYMPDGTLMFREDYPGKNETYVEDAAENWTMGIKNA
jgi:hypothetical protein